MKPIQVCLIINQYGEPKLDCWTSSPDFFMTEESKPANSTLVMLDGDLRVAETFEGIYTTPDGKEIKGYSLRPLLSGESAPQD